MGLFLQNQGPRSELQTKVAAELQERLKDRKVIDTEKTESAFIANTSKTKGVGVLIAFLFVIAVIVVAVIVSQTNR